MEITASEAKATFLTLLDRVASGEEVEITKRGRVVARIVPAGKALVLRGRLTGMATTAAREEALFSTGTPWETA